MPNCTAASSMCCVVVVVAVASAAAVALVVGGDVSRLSLSRLPRIGCPVLMPPGHCKFTFSTNCRFFMCKRWTILDYSELTPPDPKSCV